VEALEASIRKEAQVPGLDVDIVKISAAKEALDAREIVRKTIEVLMKKPAKP
jgi:hypothetical protein